jgi:HSP20 family protein
VSTIIDECLGILTILLNYSTILAEIESGAQRKSAQEVKRMAIERWQPFTELMSLRQAMDKLFEDSFVRPSRELVALGEVAAPALDIYQTANDVVVKAALPGVKSEDLSIDITGDTVTIRGETKDQQEIKREDYLYKERRYGSFARSVVLPGGLKADKAEATMEDGVLTLTIPKAEQVKPKAIKVKTKEKGKETSKAQITGKK